MGITVCNEGMDVLEQVTLLFNDTHSGLSSS